MLHTPSVSTAFGAGKGALLALCVGLLPSLVAAPLAAAQPTPWSVVSQLDLECHRVEDPTGPPARQLWISQLNPELQGKLPNQLIKLGRLEDVCVPVAKNQQVPSPDALAINRWIDLACYAAKAEPVSAQVRLDHLNPVLQHLPTESVKLVQLEQLCVPVRKRPSKLPPQVEQIVRHVDVACYSLEERTKDVQVPLRTTHLNPVIRQMQLPDRRGRLRSANQLCVPVSKGGQNPPSFALQYVRYMDFLKYDFRPTNAADVPPFTEPIPLKLDHLNPLFAGQPPFGAVLRAPVRLLVPVAKNKNWPPGGEPGRH